MQNLPSCASRSTMDGTSAFKETKGASESQFSPLRSTCLETSAITPSTCPSSSCTDRRVLVEKVAEAKAQPRARMSDLRCVKLVASLLGTVVSRHQLRPPQSTSNACSTVVSIAKSVDKNTSNKAFNKSQSVRVAGRAPSLLSMSLGPRSFDRWPLSNYS